MSDNNPNKGDYASMTICPICFNEAPYRGLTHIIVGGDEEHLARRYICLGQGVGHTIFVTTGEVKLLGVMKSIPVITSTSGDVELEKKYTDIVVSGEEWAQTPSLPEGLGEIIYPTNDVDYNDKEGTWTFKN